MKVAYVVLLLFLELFMLGCYIFATGKKSRYIKQIKKLIVVAIIASCIYSYFNITMELDMAMIMDALYFASTDVLSLFMFSFAIAYTDRKNKYKNIYKFASVLIGLDCIQLLLNVKTEHMFLLTESWYKEIFYWSCQFKWPHYGHLMLCYLLNCATMVLLLHEMMKAPKMYKRKYYSIILPFVLVLAMNGLCYSQDFPMDYSVSLYALLVGCICYYSLYSVSKKLIMVSQGYIVEEMENAIFCLDIHKNCIYANENAKKLLGGFGEAGLQVIEKYAGECIEKYAVEAKDEARWEKTRIEDGRARYYDEGFQRLRDKKGTEIGSFFTIVDATEKVESYRKEKYKATHDALTGLYNREGFFEEAANEIKKNPGIPRYMIASNVDSFKLINDLFGSAKGDELLKKQAELIHKYAKEGNICGRISSDRFAMLLPKDRFDEKVFLYAVEELRTLLRNSNYLLHYYIGVYELTDEEEHPQNMYDKANMAIESVKGDYHEIIVYYAKDILKKLIYEKKIVMEFDRAIEQQEFVMYLQPLVGTDEQAVGAEALVRWNHPERGLVFPGDFIEIYEKTGLIYRLDLYIWEKAVCKLREWKDKGEEKLYISVNISARDFYYLDIYKEITRLVEKYQVEPKRLKIEITETVLMEDIVRNMEVLYKLREYGFQIEIDDFGSGYSSLNMLKDLQADVLKIDMLFLRETENHEKSKVILKSIIAMAKQLGLKVVTEGVETKGQMDTLLVMGCDIFQGYYFDKPISITEFEMKYL